VVTVRREMQAIRIKRQGAGEQVFTRTSHQSLRRPYCRQHMGRPALKKQVAAR
jgi:hypothetical protein